MYLTSLSLENIKLFANQTFSFVDASGKPRLWTVVIGDSGLCKTTLLQAVALAVSGEKMGGRLAENAEEFRAADHEELSAQITATFLKGTERIESTLSAAPGRIDWQGGQGGPNPFDEIRGKQRPGYFVVGYGVGRYLPRSGEVAVPALPALDRVEGLFSQRHKMLGVDFFEALEKREPKLGNRYAERIRNVLLAEDKTTGEQLLPWLDNVELRGKGGLKTLQSLLKSRRFQVTVGDRKLKLPPTALSQGYQSMVAWLTDLLGHAFLEFGDVAPSKLEGIVLLDEIDLHLHPTWQRRIVPILRRVFPKLQFVVTTHSPLVLTGFAREEIIWLDLNEGQVVLRQAPSEPGMKTGSGLFTSFFDVPRAARSELLIAEQEYAELAGREEKTSDMTRRLKQLKQILEPYERDTELDFDVRESTGHTEAIAAEAPPSGVDCPDQTDGAGT